LHTKQLSCVRPISHAVLQWNMLKIEGVLCAGVTQASCGGLANAEGSSSGSRNGRRSARPSRHLPRIPGSKEKEESAEVHAKGSG
jgi:hypothetical protein